MKVPHLYLPLKRPEDVIPHLGKGDLHWKKGRSAYELAYSWGAINGIPQSVRGVLNTSIVFENCRLVDAFFEREVDLLTPGRPSQTDLMAILALENELAIMAVEAKVDEPFGPIVADWNNQSPPKIERLNSLCFLLGLNPKKVGRLRYQLLHRTASAILEAKRYRSSKAIMLVQSFDPKKAWIEEFFKFSEEMGFSPFNVGELSGSLDCQGVELFLGWCPDKIR